MGSQDLNSSLKERYNLRRQQGGGNSLREDPETKTACSAPWEQCLTNWRDNQGHLRRMMSSGGMHREPGIGVWSWGDGWWDPLKVPKEEGI